MTPFDALILGIIEGVTEFLPISSTGHLILAASLLHVPPGDFAKTFEIAIQLGAILAVAALYRRAFLSRDRLLKIAAALIPTGVVGFALYRFTKTYLLGNEIVVLASLFFGGLALIVFEYFYGAREDARAADPETPLSYRQAITVGLAQAVAIIPGVSRSGATIVGGMLAGVSRAAIVEFSFLLAVPTMLAATGLSLYKSHALSYTSGEWIVLSIGFAVSFLVAMPIAKWFLKYVRMHSFTAFGIYRILLSLAFALWLIIS